MFVRSIDLISRQADVLALHSAGKTTSEIAAQLGMPYTQARYIQLQMGIAAHPALRCNSLIAINGERSHGMTERRSRIAKWLRTDTLATDRQMAMATGVSEETIRTDRRAVRTRAQGEQGARHNSAGTGKRR
jgi:DNA-binding CsgD family transcriptional regulator